MLPPSVISEVKRLLALGELSQRSIARLTGASRVVVHRVASGKRKDRVSKTHEAWKVPWESSDSTKPGRCPTCGAKVKLPCLACLIRPGAKIVSETETPLAGELSLKPEHQKRYEQVKAWREMQDDPNFTATPKDWPFRRSGMSKARCGMK